MMGCLNNPDSPLTNDLQCTCGTISRAIFAPFSRKVAPYDTLAYMFTCTYNKAMLALKIILFSSIFCCLVQI